MQRRSNIFFEKPRLVWAGVCHSLASVLVTRAVRKTLKLQNAHFNSWTGYISCKLQFCFLQDQDSKKFHPPYYSQQKDKEGCSSFWYLSYFRHLQTASASLLWTREVDALAQLLRNSQRRGILENTLSTIMRGLAIWTTITTTNQTWIDISMNL